MPKEKKLIKADEPQIQKNKPPHQNFWYGRGKYPLPGFFEQEEAKKFGIQYLKMEIF